MFTRKLGGHQRFYSNVKLIMSTFEVQLNYFTLTIMTENSFFWIRRSFPCLQSKFCAKIIFSVCVKHSYRAFWIFSFDHSLMGDDGFRRLQTLVENHDPHRDNKELRDLWPAFKKTFDYYEPFLMYFS